MSFLAAEPKRPHGSATDGSRKKSRTAPKKPITTEEAIAAIRKDWKIVKMARKKDKKYANFLQDKHVVKEVVGMNHVMLRYMPAAAQDDTSIVYDAVCAMNENEGEVSMHPTAFQWASDRLKNDVDFVRELRETLADSLNPKRTIQTFDGFVPEAILRQIDPISPHWLVKSIETCDFELFKTQTTIVPTQREALLRKLCYVCQLNKPSGSKLEACRQIFVALASGQYGQRSLERMVNTNSNRRRHVLVEWLVEYAGDDIFQDVTLRIRAATNAGIFSSDVAKAIGYQLGKPQTLEKIKQLGMRLVEITFGKKKLIIMVYTEVMKSIKKITMPPIHIMMDAAHRGDDIPIVPEQSVDYDQIVVGLIQQCSSRMTFGAEVFGNLLLVAVEEHYTNTVSLLLFLGAAPNFQDVAILGGRTALHIAVNNHDLDIIRLLISEGANHVQTHNGNRTVLMLSPSLPVTQCLLEYGPDLDEVDDDGDTALHMQVENGHAENVAELLRRGANPNLANRVGRTPVFKAVNTLSVECARELFNPRYVIDINHKDINWNTVLHCLAETNEGAAGRVRTIFTLIMARNPDLSLLNKEARTALRCSKSPLMSKLLVSVGCGAKWTGHGDWDDDRNLFKHLPADTFDDSPIVLRLQEDEMQGDDETTAPVRLTCEHVFNATFLRQWLNTNRFGYEGSTTQWKTTCVMCRKEITSIELLSSAEAANWDNFEGQAKAEEQKLDTELKEWEKDEDYKQKQSAVAAAADALSSAQNALKKAEDAKREKERERREIREASDVRQKAFRDRRLLQQLKDLGL